jgi:hypothetical protein
VRQEDVDVLPGDDEHTKDVRVQECDRRYDVETDGSAVL